MQEDLGGSGDALEQQRARRGWDVVDTERARRGRATELEVRRVVDEVGQCARYTSRRQWAA